MTAPLRIAAEPYAALPGGYDPEVSIADRAHAALFEFLRDAPSWGPREIGAWLGGAYREATEVADDVLVEADEERSGVRPLGAFGLGNDAHAVLLAVHERITALLSDVSWAHDRAELEQWALSEGLVVVVRGARGACELAPVHHPGVALFRGLVALFLADYLAYPGRYTAA